jgi:hypothetical protein
MLAMDKIVNNPKQKKQSVFSPPSPVSSPPGEDILLADSVLADDGAARAVSGFTNRRPMIHPLPGERAGVRARSSIAESPRL